MAHCRREVVAALALGCSWMAISPAAEAQVAADEAGARASEPRAIEVGEIVVTARGRAEKLKDAPISVAAFTDKQVERQQIKQPSDFIALTSNIGFSQTTNAGDTAVQIRGIIQPRDSEPPFVLVLDGVVAPNTNAFNRALVDVEQIEVLKGPQGALYGRNAIAGAIIINTKKPTNDFSGQVSASYATGDEVDVSGTLSGPIVRDKLFFRVSGSVLNRSGYFFNNTLQERVDPYKEVTARARLIWNATDRLTVDFRYDYGKIDGYAINFNAQANIYTPFLSANPTGVFKLGGGVDINNASQPYFTNVQSLDRQKRHELALKSDYKVEFGTFTLTGSYSKLTEPAAGDGAVNLSLFSENLPGDTMIKLLPGIDQAGYSNGPNENPQLQTRNETDKTVELRFTSRADMPLRFTVGGYYADIDREVILANVIDKGGIVLPNPVNGPDTLSPTANLTWTRTRNKVKSGFVNLSYDILDDLEVTAAARYDSETKTNVLLTPHIIRPSNPAGDPADPASYLTPYLDNDPARTRSATFSKLQPKFTARYKVTQDQAVYVTYGLAQRSGGFNPVGSRATVLSVDGDLNSTVQDQFPAEISRSWEAGFKTSWFDRRLTLNGAAFSTTVLNANNFQFYPISFSRVVTTVDRIALKGFEIEGIVRPTPELTLNASFGYVDTTVKVNRNNPATVGNRQAYTPEYTINIGAQYVRPVTGTIDLLARIAYQRIGSEYFNIENSPGTLRSPVDLVDASLALETKKWTFSVYGKNIFDKKYNTDAVILPASFGLYNFVTHAPPAIYGVRGVYKF